MVPGPKPGPAPRPRGGVRSPAARTALQQLLADLEAERTGQSAPRAGVPAQPPSTAPRRAVIQRRVPQVVRAAHQPGWFLQTVARVEREVRYAGIAEPLRSRLIALIEERQRQQRD